VLKIQDIQAKEGEVVYGQFHVDGVAIPMILAAGKQDGATLVMHCAQHRTEFPGTMAAHHLLNGFDFAAIRGTVVILPLVDLPAITSTRVADVYPRQNQDMKQYAGQLRSNINRVWPGDAGGSWVDRLAYALTHEVFAKASAVLDFHACRLCDAPFAAYLDTHDASRELAYAFGTRLLDEADADSFPPGQLHRTIPPAIDVPAILIEACPASHFVTEDIAEVMVRGTFNVMRHFDMIDGQLELPPVQAVSRRSDPVTIFLSEHLGFFGPCKQRGEVVSAGELIGQVHSLSHFEVVQELRALADGVLPSVGPDHSMLVLPGEQVATFKPVRDVRRHT